jgi:hypothetical protein
LRKKHCSDEGVSFLGLVSPGGWERLDIAVVASESVDSALNKNESELGVLVLTALLQMLSDVHSLFDKVVEVFGDLWGEADLLQDSEDFASSDALHLWETLRVSESHTDSRGRVTLLGELRDRVNDVVGGDTNPAWCGLSVWEASTSDTLAL